MSVSQEQFGVLDNRFLAKSVGVLDPHPPILVHQETKLVEILSRLQQEKIGCVLVTDVSGKLTGIFTERDALLKVALKPLDVNITPVFRVMTHNPQTATMTTTVALALNMMSHGGYRHIPIVDDEGYPVGVISVKDIVDYVAHTVTRDLSKFGG